LAWFLSRQGQYEAARKYYQQSIACFAVHQSYEALVFPHFGNGIIAYQYGEYPQAQASFLESIRAGEKSGEAVWANMARLYLVILDFVDGANTHPEEDLLKILLTFEQTNNLQGQMRTLKQMGDVAHIQGNFMQAKNFYERTLKLAQNIEQMGVEAPLQMKLGIIASEEGNYPLAKHLLTSSLHTFEHIGDRKNIALVLGELGSIAALEDQIQAAHRYFQQALEIAVSTSQRPLALDVLCGISCMLARAQRQENAWELMSLVQAHPATHPLTLRRVNRFLKTCQLSVSEPKWEEALERGRGLDLDKVINEYRLIL
jgi:tetratricopeptide (TPR) repeat protein